MLGEVEVQSGRAQHDHSKAAHERGMMAALTMVQFPLRLSH